MPTAANSEREAREPGASRIPEERSDDRDLDHPPGGSPSGGGRGDRLVISRRWFLGWLAGGVALLFGGRRLCQEVTAGGGPAGRSQAAGTRLREEFPVRSVDSLPDVPPNDWLIEVFGLVSKPRLISSEAWTELPAREQTVDFHCVEGWGVSQVRWSGVRVADVLDLAEPLPTATYVVFHAYDGLYTDSLPLALAREEQTLLADGIDGVPLPPQHGGPVRLVVPSQLAYKSVKWVRRIELTDHQVGGYWENYGYPYDAPVTRAQPNVRGADG